MIGPGWLAEAGNALLDFVYPPRCYLCGAVGDWVCEACRDAWPRPCPPRCDVCGERLDAAYSLRSPEAGGCRWCARGLAPLAAAGYACLFQEGAREAVHLLKYAGKRRLAPAMADAMEFAARTSSALQGVDAVVPVALHPKRLRRRGYNQADWLAEELASRLDRDTGAWLTRVRDTRPQVGLSAAERRENMREAFTASPDAAGKRILLLDDVATTGATARDAARALKARGAASVRLLTFARDF